jgi:soluble lytic murein transglycosylase-like protein
MGYGFGSGKARNVFNRFCFILLLAMPLLAESVPSALPADASQTQPATKVRTVVYADVKTGRLVRTAAAPVTQNQAPSKAPQELTDLVDRIAAQQGVEAPLVQSVIQAESNYNPVAVSPKGAQGLMQLIPSTARRFGVTDTFNVAENIQGGVRYLRFLLDYYHDDYTKSIAAYNAGEAAVDKYNGVPPYAETLGYVRTVSKNLSAERKRQASSAQPIAGGISTPAEPDPSVPRHIQAYVGADGVIYYRTP